MGKLTAYLNPAVAAIALGLCLALPGTAQAQELGGAQLQTRPPTRAETQVRLLEQLKSTDPSIWRQAESDILNQWSESGSPAMDLLLQRGRKAINAGDDTAAADHLTALVDHAPDFAEGYNARATAYYQAGLFGPALADIAQALKLNPHHFGALAGLGMILDESGFPDEALKAFRASAAIDPHQSAVEKAIARLENKARGQEL